MKVVNTLLAASVLLPSSVLAQNLDTLLPPANTPLLNQEALDLLLPQAPEDGISLSALPGEEIILESLQSVTLLSNPDQVSQIPQEPGFHTLDLPELDTADTAQFINQQLNRPISRESLERLTYVLQTAVRAQGRPFSLVYLPPQDITEGHLAVVVQDSRLGTIRVFESTYFSEDSYRNRIAINSGDIISLDTIQRGLDRINANPYRQVRVSVEPGEEPLTTDIVLDTLETRPLRFTLNAHNQGTAATGEHRIALGVDWGNVFGTAHRLSTQVVGNDNFRNTRALSMNYQLDLPRAHALQISAVYSQVESDLPAPLDQNGTSWQAAVQYSIPLDWTFADATHNVSLGVDLKSSDNNLNFVAPPIIFPVTDTLTRILQLRGEYQLSRPDRFGVTSAAATLVIAPGDLIGHNNDLAFNESRFAATADYQYLRVRLDRLVRLPTLPDYTWSLSATGQIASGNLLGSEQLSAGGFATVRGYDEGATIGDEGVLFRQELAANNLWRGNNNTFSTSVFVFHDMAYTRSAEPIPQESSFTIASAGLGLRFSMPRGLQLDAAYGWPLNEPDALTVDNSGSFHFNARLTF